MSFFLLIQALFFYIPRVFWRTFSTRSGIDINDLVEAAQNYKAVSKYEARESHIRYLVDNIDQYVDDPRRYDKSRKMAKIKKGLALIIPCAGRFMGNYLVILYFVVKIGYIANTIFQAFLLSRFLGKTFYLYGIDFLYRVKEGGSWIFESKYFPSNLNLF